MLHKIKGLNTSIESKELIRFVRRLEDRGWKEECPTLQGWEFSKKPGKFCDINFSTGAISFYQIKVS